MTPEQFTYWLNGFLELSNPKELTEHQIIIIKDHLNIVFNKVTPNYDGVQTPNLYCSRDEPFIC